ncbi:MAG: hypothetical protein GX187_03075 [Clostridiaceae bacterium]|nr:hypothetical protein [Clostridiaceae bacterium]
MKRKTSSVLKQGVLLFCVIFSVTTLLSSSLQLFSGQLTDTNLHILNRGALVLIDVITFMLFDGIKPKRKVLSFLVPYAISMGLVFLYVWIIGFFETLHPNAYRDVFLNFTAVAVILWIIATLKDNLKTKKQDTKI